MHRSFYRIAREVQGRLGRAEYALQAASELGARLAEENRALAQQLRVAGIVSKNVVLTRYRVKSVLGTLYSVKI